MKTKTYTVNIKEVHNVGVVIEARNIKEARQKAAEMVAKEQIDYSTLAYSHHLPASKWPVECAD